MGFIDTIKTTILEWLKTFSNKPSFISSKRLERFAVFTTMLACSIYFLIKSITSCSLTATDLMVVVVAWLGYCGFNVIQGRKDNQTINKEENGNQIS